MCNFIFALFRLSTKISPEVLNLEKWDNTFEESGVHCTVWIWYATHTDFMRNTEKRSLLKRRTYLVDKHDTNYSVPIISNLNIRSTTYTYVPLIPLSETTVSWCSILTIQIYDAFLGRTRAVKKWREPRKFLLIYFNLPV